MNHIPDCILQFSRHGILSLTHSLIILLMGSSLSWQCNHVINGGVEDQDNQSVPVSTRIGRYLLSIGRVTQISQKELLTELSELATTKKAQFESSNAAVFFVKLAIEWSLALLSCCSSGKLSRNSIEQIETWFNMSIAISSEIGKSQQTNCNEVQSDIEKLTAQYRSFRSWSSSATTSFNQQKNLHFCSSLLILQLLMLTMLSLTNVDELTIFSNLMYDLLEKYSILQFSTTKNFDLGTKPDFDLDAPYHLKIPLDDIHEISKHVKNNTDALAEDIAILVLQYVSSQIMHLAQYHTHSRDTTKDEFIAIGHTITALDKTRVLLVESKKKTQNANRQSYRSLRQHNTGECNRNISPSNYVLNRLSYVCGTSIKDSVHNAISANNNVIGPNNTVIYSWMNRHMKDGKVDKSESLSCNLRSPDRIILIPNKKSTPRKKFTNEETEEVRIGMQEGKSWKQILDGSVCLKANGRTNVNIKDLARRLDFNYKVRPVRRNYTEDEKKLVEEGVEDHGLTFQQILEQNPEHFENRSSQDLRLCYRSIFNKKARRAGRSSVI